MNRRVASVALLLAAIPIVRAAEFYRISGVVVNATTGAPLARARVILAVSGTADIAGAMVAGDDGKFSFDVARGKYSLAAGTRAIKTQLGARRPDSQLSTAVVTGPAQNTTGLVLRWYPPVAIAGRVLDDRGEPVESALVQLLASRVVGGRRAVATFLWERTDDSGEYRFGDLPAGTYYLAVTGTPWYATNSGHEPAPAAAAAYVPVYSGNTGDRSRAAPLVLRPGEETRADFTLATVPGAQVTVTHEAPADASGSIGLVMDGLGGEDGYQRQQHLYRGGGPVKFGGVPPGRFAVVVDASSGLHHYFGRREIQVGGVDTPVNVEVRPLATVSGKVNFQNPSAPRRSPVYVRLLFDGRPGNQTTAVQPDGSFHFPDVQTWKYRPTVSSRDGHFAKEMRVEGAEFRDGVIDVREGQTITLRMMASDETGSVEGLVINGEFAVEGALVILAPAADSADPLPYRGFQTDSDGSFDYKNVPAGDYLLFAVEDSNFEYANAAAVRPYRTRAKSVRVEPHSSSGGHRLSVIGLEAK